MLARAKPSEGFDRDGFVIGTLPSNLTEACREMIRRLEPVPMTAEDCAPGFRSSQKIYKVAETLNAGHRYYHPPPESMAPLREIFEALEGPVREALGSPWKVINTRIVETLPSAEVMGPNTWHGDGFPPEILKVMIYLSGAGRRLGTTELQLPEDRSMIVEGPPGTWLLFRNSVVIHRGLPPEDQPRLAIEVTLVPARRRGIAPLFAGLNAIYPEYPWSLHPWVRGFAGLFSGGAPENPGPTPEDAKAARKAAKKAARAEEKQARAERELRRRRRRQRLVRALNAVIPPSALNVGGGSEFAHFRWLNLDGAPGPANPSPFRFDPACRFPLGDRSVRTVYTSHCLEHLDDPTVDRVLDEARRVLAAPGRLVVKIPDFDRGLSTWRAGDESFFDAERWGMARLTTLWARRGVQDTLDTRAAMVFCGFWNDAYGDHYADRREDERGYHGPAVIAPEVLRRMAHESSPHALAAALRQHVVRSESSYHFNHQNAWSRDELRRLLELHGFVVETTDADAVIAAASDIPGIVDLRAESMYCLARPAGT